MNVYSMFVHMHSGLRWLVLLFMILAIVNAIVKLRAKAKQSEKECIINRLALIVMHLQLLVGFVLYFISPKVVFSANAMKDTFLRFFLVEHLSLMVIAVILVTIGYVKSDRAADIGKKNRLLIIYYSIALILVLVAIPWPFRALKKRSL